MTTVAAAPVLDAALGYAASGWAVFPVHTIRGGHCSCGRAACESPAKHPHTANGLKDATTDEATIRAWWSRWPDANVAVVTGERSGLVVLDVDGAVGEASLDELLREHGPLPDTIRSRTGGEGRHLLFRHPGETIRNSAGSKLGPCLDIRGDGGYIVAPPSSHKSGRHYEWEALAVDLADMPAWLLERLREPPPAPLPPPAPIRRPDANGNAYALEALAREAAALRSTGQGGRNHQLNASAFNLGQLVGGGELAESDVVAELTAAALEVGLGEREISATLASGLEGGKRQPRTAPERPGASYVPRPPVPVDDGDPGPTEPPAGPTEPPKRHLALVAGGEGDPPPPAPAEPDEAAPDPNLTDLRNARRLVARHGGDLRYCPDWHTWLAWDGQRWKRDSTGEVYRRAKKVVSQLYLMAAELPFDDRKKLVKEALACERQGRLEAMVTCAQTELEVVIASDRLDADPWLLNCANGTVDLRTGELRPHRREDGLTKLAPVDYDPEAPAPVFKAFLEQIFEGNAELIGFLQRAIGYALTGSVREQVMFFLHGTGANGKSTLIGALQGLLGEYSKATERDLLIARRGEMHPTGVADLMGVRFAVAEEVEAGRRLDEGLVKLLTGGDRVKARFMRQDFFEFTPTHKLFFAANHKPVVRGTDHAIWRRIRLVPFNVTIAEDQRDRQLGAKLAAEAPGILAWAVRGCLEWQRHGLGQAPAVAEATEAYRAEMDVLGQFLEDRCDVGPGYEIPASELRKLYVSWCQDTGEYILTAKAVGQLLIERGFDRARRGRSKTWTWLGLRERGPIAAPLFEPSPEEEWGEDPPPEPPDGDAAPCGPIAAHSPVPPSCARPGEESIQTKGRDGAVGAAPDSGSDETWEEEF